MSRARIRTKDRQARRRTADKTEWRSYRGTVIVEDNARARA